MVGEQMSSICPHRRWCVDFQHQASGIKLFLSNACVIAGDWYILFFFHNMNAESVVTKSVGDASSFHPLGRCRQVWQRNTGTPEHTNTSPTVTTRTLPAQHGMPRSTLTSVSNRVDGTTWNPWGECIELLLGTDAITRSCSLQGC